MPRRSGLASLLILALLAVLLPADLGMGCAVCGKLGTCCCNLRAATATAAHCTARACPMTAPSKPATEGSLTAQLRTDRFGVFPAKVLPPAPALAGRVAESALRLPDAHRCAPPAPPPRRVRIV